MDAGNALQLLGGTFPSWHSSTHSSTSSGVFTGSRVANYQTATWLLDHWKYFPPSANKRLRAEHTGEEAGNCSWFKEGGGVWEQRKVNSSFSHWGESGASLLWMTKATNGWFNTKTDLSVWRAAKTHRCSVQTVVGSELDWTEPDCGVVQDWFLIDRSEGFSDSCVCLLPLYLNIFCVCRRRPCRQQVVRSDLQHMAVYGHWGPNRGGGELPKLSRDQHKTITNLPACWGLGPH